ncbi:prepilin-type N-terminal cleavage/methylation domain-containing protein [Lachnoclostridium sp. Marseille-P6806]|uniref:prepilin-type N-terminal cleavage/methylation domain-containing protein n=1 Tax=Lachnoclostridium sp. Marseille-P6806 TaxID=2364793 RepID=UPI0010324F1D|nr:prepilin-type N-terminal cleavage/methylation domain-containing protein [Lachnoclostridium sp. Marseille-P6806]
MFRKIRENREGFTLAELLIVVAIIGVLVAVSIPIFTAQLEKAREATDMANMRAAKAAAVTAYLTEDTALAVGSAQAGAVDLYYDANNGVLKTAAAGIAKYGKGTTADGGQAPADGYMGYQGNTDAKDKILKVTVAQDGSITEAWQ